MTQSLLAMANSIKNKASTPLQWNQMYIQTLKKTNGSVRKLSNYRGIFLVPIISIIFEKLLKTELHHYWKKIRPSFRQGLLKTRELWITFSYFLPD